MSLAAWVVAALLVAAPAPAAPVSADLRAGAAVPSAATAAPGPTPPVAVAQSGVGAHTVRIPAVAVTTHGTVVVAYDRRNISAADLPGSIDVRVRRSTDGGRTWSAGITVAAHAGGDTPSTAAGSGDPQLLADRVTGRVWLFCISAPAGIGLQNSSTATAPGDPTTVHLVARWSDDDGRTWSLPRDLTAALKPAGATALYASAGHGTQFDDGTLAVPYAYATGAVGHATVAYSPDHGATWRPSGRDITTGVSEHHLVQLADSRLLDDARADPPRGARVLSRGNSIFRPWTSGPAAALPDPGDNGDLVRVPGHPTWLLESSTSDAHARRNLVVHLSRDGGTTWAPLWTVEPGPAGYSSMAALPSGEVGILYETPAGLSWRTFPVG